MKKTMTALFASLFLTIIPSASFAWCDNYEDCNTCNWNCETFFCGDWTVGADLLVWKASYTEMDFAAKLESSNGTGTLDRAYFCPDSKPGFRLFLGKENLFCDWDFYASYRYMDSDDSKEVLGGSNIDLTIPYLFFSANFGKITGSFSSQYHEWEALLGRKVNCSQCTVFMPYFGAAGIILKQKEEMLGYELTTSESPLASLNWKRKYWGAGLRFGAYLEHQISYCFSLFGNGSTSILYGDVSGKSESVVPAFPLNLTENEGSGCRMTPGWQIQAGIKYMTEICCQKFNLRLGYEMVSWNNLPNPARSTSPIVPDRRELTYGGSPSIRSIGYQGVFAGLDFIF